MKKGIRFLVLVILFYILHIPLTAQESLGLFLMEPTGKSINGLPEMALLPDSSPVCRSTAELAGKSFMGDAIRLYQLAQQYLVNAGQLNMISPAYLAVTKNQGGFAKKGFCLANPDGSVSELPDAGYVDLTAGYISGPPGRLESVTQIYPHELGHIIYRMLCSPDTAAGRSYNVNMHYFSVITDYQTAFSEGFSEFIENASRMYERDDLIRQAVFKDAEAVGTFASRRCLGFERDYEWFLRLDYYKSSMPLWYQKFEDCKRYMYAVSDNAAYVNASPTLKSVEDMITFRNTGIEQTGRHKNKVQCMACEGFVSTFFTHLASGELTDHYRDAEFYKLFLEDTSRKIVPEKEFSPIENFLLKSFYVINHHVRYGYSERAQLMDFIEGYTCEFPDEAADMLKIYRYLTGSKFDQDLPPQLWILVKGFRHRVLLMDAFGASSIPAYTFDLNAAEAEDLMTIDGIGREDAGKIIAYRNETGYFRSLDETGRIPGLDEPVKAKLQDSRMDDSYFDGIKSDGLNITALITGSLLHLIKRGLVYYAFLAMILFALNFKDLRLKKLGIIFTRYLLIWLLFIISGLAAVIFNGDPVKFFSVFALIYIIITGFILRKNRPGLIKGMIMTMIMSIMVIYSLI